MAASSPGQDIKDPGYRNWQKVVLALWYMKRALDSFVRTEVNLIHEELKKKIYHGTRVPHPKCRSCSARDITQNEHKVWGFWKTRHCQAGCHVWLDKLLNLFDNPSSDRIYWNNCDVTSWAYNAWECAKAFMPRGQKPTNTDPKESDHQALLTLMANCRHFHGLLSPIGLKQTHKVLNVRNTTMHAPQMELTDGEMMGFIKKIIDLLEDPKHLYRLPDCISAGSYIKQIRDSSVDVFLDLEQDIKALREIQGDAIGKLQNQFGLQKHDMESIHQELLQLKLDTSACLTDLEENVDTRFSTIQENLQSVDSRVSCQDTRCQRIEENVQSMESKLNTTQHQVSSQDTRCQRIEENLQSVDSRVSCQDTRCQRIEENLQSVDSRVSCQDTRCQRIEENVQSLGGEVLHLREQVVESSKFSGSQGKTSGQIQPTEEDVQDIKQLLITAYEGIQIISINPVFNIPVNMMNLEDFYTDIVIEEKIEKSPRSRNDKQHVKVTSLRQMFEKGDKKIRRIVLKAPAGQGKSTFCRKLVHIWCSVQNKKLKPQQDDITSDKSETSGLKDEDEMLRFDVLLYICLRHISNEKTLMDVVYTQFPLHESQDLSHRSHIEALIGQAEENKVLLIMDGLDEMDNSLSFIDKIMQKRLYPHLTVLATTRPWKIDQLGLIRSAHIDLLLDLQGFSYENSMLFAKRIFDKYYNDESATKHFKQDIWKNSMIAGLIKIPLLLLFIIHVWYERKSFPETINELYMEILNVMVKRYIEGKNTEQKSNLEQDKKKNIVPKTWPLESTTFIVTPKLRNLSLVHYFGEGFLASLCEVAYHFLITVAEETSFFLAEKDCMNILDKGMKLRDTDLKFDAKEFSLVFEEKTLVELLGENGSSKLQTALNLGILSKSDSPGIRYKKVYLTFLHKTVQEFLAAINICCREGRCSIFLKSLKKLHDVFQNENIIMFVAGISTSHCEMIFEKIYEVCDKEMDQDRAEINGYDMRNLCRLYLACIKEFCSKPVSLKLHSLFAGSKENWNILHMSYYRTHLRYLKLVGFVLGDATLDLSESKSLTVLSLTDMNINGELFLSECTQLRRLELSGKSGNGSNANALDLFEPNYQNKLWLGDQFMKCKLLLSQCTRLRSLKLAYCCLNDSTLDLSESNCLEYLSLKYVTMNGKLLLSQCTQLRYLKLAYCCLNDGTLDLSESNCLEYLGLECVTMNNKLFPSECTWFMGLKWDDCSLHDTTLDLSASNFQEHLSLQFMSMNGILYNSESIQLTDLSLNDYSSDEYIYDLPESNCLEYLHLLYVTMKGKLLLSQCTQLRCLKLAYGMPYDRKRYISQYDKQNLKQVTIKSKLFLSKHTQLFHLKLDSCSLHDATLDLSESNSLEYLSLESVTMKGLFVSKCTRLRSLKLADCEFDDSTFSLSQFNYLNKVSFASVTGRVKLLLSKCTKLRHLKLAHCSLDDATLDLTESNCLEYFSFVDVTMKGKLSLSKGTQLSSLKLSECNLDDTILDLSESNCLNKVNLVDVTMKGNNNVMLYNSMSMCTQLKELSLKNLDLGDALLSLDKMENLDHLTIINVTMCKDGYMMLCNSISMCTKLTHLTLTNLDLGDTIPHMENLKELELANVTISLQYQDYIKSSVQHLQSLHHFNFEHKELIIEKAADCCEKCVMNYGNKRDIDDDDDFYDDEDDDDDFDVDGTDSDYNEDEYEDKYYDEEFDIHPVYDFDHYFERDYDVHYSDDEILYD